MKNSEFKKQINSLPADSLLRNHVYVFKLPAEDYNAGFDIVGLHKFVLEKSTKWNLSRNIPEFSTSINFFKNLVNIIEAVVSSVDEFNLLNKHRNLINNLDRISNQVFLPDSARIIFLLNIYNNHNQYFQGAFAALNGSLDYGDFGNIDYFNGAILASKFAINDIEIIDRGEAETKSFRQIKSDFDLERTELLIDFESTIASTKDEAKKRIDYLKDLTNSWNKHFNDQLESLQKSADEKFETSDLKADELLKKALKKKIQLEQTFREDMRFQAPSEYWKERAAYLNKEGKKFMLWLIFLIVISAGILFGLLLLTPEDLLLNVFSGSLSKAIRWSILFIMLISILFIGIQALKKAMFSSFHLARDAEEREKLTVFYLSLIKNSTITQEDRSMVLQSLFSRTDTGMLKEEANPTMPGIIDKIRS